jgi:hypothetical protein
LTLHVGSRRPDLSHDVSDRIAGRKRAEQMGSLDASIERLLEGEWDEGSDED